MTLFCVSCVLIVVAVLGVVDAMLPDDDFWTNFRTTFGDYR